MPLESKLQAKIIKDLKKKNYLVVKIIRCSVSGWPDIEFLKDGRTIRIETKASGKKLRPLQEYIHEQIKLFGGEVYIVDTFEAYLKLNL